MITEIQKAQILLDTFASGVLSSGSHEPPNGECKVCVEELRCLAYLVVWDDGVPSLPEGWDRDAWTDARDGLTATELA